MRDWIPHDGGKCPVAPGTVVDVKFRCGDVAAAPEVSDYIADAYRWENIESGIHLDHDIVGYRVVHPAPVDREFRRAVFLAVVSQALDAARSPAEEEMAIEWAWAKADEAIEQEGA